MKQKILDCTYRNRYSFHAPAHPCSTTHPWRFGGHLCATFFCPQLPRRGGPVDDNRWVETGFSLRDSAPEPIDSCLELGGWVEGLVARLPRPFPAYHTNFLGDTPSLWAKEIYIPGGLPNYYHSVQYHWCKRMDEKCAGLMRNSSWR